MRVGLPALLVLSAALAAPTAAALDVLPSQTRLGETEARLLVRLPHGGRLLVEGGPGVSAALAPPEGAPGAFRALPATFEVEARSPEASWHGLSGTVEVVLRREDPHAAARVALRDGGGAGVEVEWPPAEARGAPLPSGAALAASAALVAALTRRRLTRGAGGGGGA